MPTQENYSQRFLPCSCSLLVFQLVSWFQPKRSPLSRLSVSAKECDMVKGSLPKGDLHAETSFWSALYKGATEAKGHGASLHQ